jgi:hypothetical protein
LTGTAFDVGVTARPVLITALPPYANNSRTHSPEQVEEILASLIEFGWTNPALYDAQGIIAGHGRVQAAELAYSRGLTIRLAPGGPDAPELPVGTALALDCSGWSSEQRRAYIIADNRLAEKAGWDAGLLRLELSAIQDAGFDIGVTGFPDLSAVDALLGAPPPTDPIGDPPQDAYQEQYGVVVICRDAAEQKALYERFRDEKVGREVKVVNT